MKKYCCYYVMPGRTMDEQELRDQWKNETIGFLALASIKGVGFWTMYKIAEQSIGFKDLLKTSVPANLEEYLRTNIRNNIGDWNTFQKILWRNGLEQARALARDGIRLIFKDQAEFPVELRKIEQAPHWIFVQGDISNLHKKSVSIVGTRKPSGDGLFLTKLVVSALAHKEVPTISGLATGIDQCAHIESIRYGIPTVAILGTGIKKNYPSGSDSLRAEILKHGGTILSEYLPDQSYSAENFVRRNRIQAALCNTLIPVEWNIKSGTAHTVEFAYKYKKKIANVYLPLSYELRDELRYSELNRSARSFEVPQWLDELIEYIESGKLDENCLEAEQQGFDF